MNGPMRGLTNQKLFELQGTGVLSRIAQFFKELEAIPLEPQFREHDLKIEHYVISTDSFQ